MLLFGEGEHEISCQIPEKGVIPQSSFEERDDNLHRQKETSLDNVDDCSLYSDLLLA
jgi:hypothetical protein